MSIILIQMHNSNNNNSHHSPGRFAALAGANPQCPRSYQKNLIFQSALPSRFALAPQTAFSG